MSSSTILPKISLPTILSTITTHYKPKMVSLLNDTVEFRVSKLKGDFIWHTHESTDELFYVISGGPLHMGIRHPVGSEGSEVGREETVVLEVGDMFVVPKGVQHQPRAENEVSVMVVETAGESTTGNQVDR
jgi:mannose-6-phosphate isomerase-like protein (cupin superfamily)